MLSWQIVGAAQAILLAGAIWWLKKRNDELPLIANALIAYFSTYRYISVCYLGAPSVNLSNFGIPPITKEEVLHALNLILLGQVVLTGAYAATQRKIIPIVRPGIHPGVAAWMRAKIIPLALLSLPLAMLIRNRVNNMVESGSTLSYGVSAYLYQLPMLLLGFLTLLVALWRVGGLRTKAQQWLLLVFMASVFWFTFSPGGRFPLLGWMIAASVIVASSFSFWPKISWITLAGALVLGLFSFAGTLRNDMADREWRREMTLDRAKVAEDANMLDGFVISALPYGNLLPFRYGGEHLEILARVIPRAWWPNKPVGGGALVALYGLSDSVSGFTLGISPSLFGSFYVEGGVAGIVVLSLLYGMGAGYIVRRSADVEPMAGVVMRAVLSASAIPLLRGGDLPGIYAWIGMSFWPCIVVLWLRRREFRLVTPKTGRGVRRLSPQAGRPNPAGIPAARMRQRNPTIRRTGLPSPGEF